MFDVAGRLAEGRFVVDHFAQYLRACEALGYHHARPPGAVDDVYGSEEGLDLRALDTDHAALESAVRVVRAAAQIQDEQQAGLAAAWRGSGGQAAAEFLRRHGEASARATAALATAADAVAGLRDDVWRIVDGKVSSGQEVDARTDAVRGEWLAAAQTVRSGVGDRAAASELVDQHVKPFVDSDIQAEWVAALEAAREAVAQCFDAAIRTVGAEPAAAFEMPDGSGATWAAPAGYAAGAASPVPVPAPGAPPPALGAAAPWTAPQSWPAAAPGSDPAAAAPASGAAPSLGSLGGGGGVPGIGSGLSGLSTLGQQIGDLLGGLLPSAGDALDAGDDAIAEDPIDEPGLEVGGPELDDEEPGGDPNEEDEATEGDPDAEDEATEDGAGDDEATGDDEAAADDEAADVEAVESAGPADVDCCGGEDPASSAAGESVAAPGAPPESAATPPEVLTPTPAPVAAEAVAPEPAPAEAGTPCEIAADELPQVGE